MGETELIEQIWIHLQVAAYVSAKKLRALTGQKVERLWAFGVQCGVMADRRRAAVAVRVERRRAQ